MSNQYAGYPADAGLPRSVDRVHVSKVTPQSFWEQYVCPRKPVVLDGHLKDAAWKASQLWTDAYLTEHAGNAKLEVEERHSEAEGYGKGRKTRMTFWECLRRLAAGDTTLYLTTQQVAVGEDGHPEVYGHPIIELARDLPVRPALLGNLIPQQINVWAGCAPDGSSTGLHHDYHDNLYVLLRGKKRFRLYPPSLADRMYVYGQVQRVHPNGRIVHKSQGDVLADGSDAREVALWRARREAERELKEAEEAVSRGEEGAEERLAVAEEKLDQALEAALEDEGAWEEGFDDFDALDAGGEEDSDDGGEDEEEGCGNKGSPGGPSAASDTGKAGDPDSFSRIDLSRPAKQLHKEFPLFPGVEAAMVCDVSAGQMLFVPAGWFHEVTSFSMPGSPTHLALNYWCHPPDNLDPGPKGFQQPYKSGFWPDVWEGRAHKYAAAASAEPAVPTPEAAAGLAPSAVGATPRADLIAGREKAVPVKQQEQEERPQQEQRDEGVEQEAWAAGEAVQPREAVQSRKRRREEHSDLCEAPHGLKARIVHQFAGFFGFGRRQFLHRFINVKLRGSAGQEGVQ